MYDYRNWTPEQRKAAIADRKRRGYPWHSPPHLVNPDTFHIITGTCYEHRRILNSEDRMKWFETELLQHVEHQNLTCAAWVVLPNHYHLLVKVDDIDQFTRLQGQLHGRSSRVFNQQDNQTGRKVWHRCQDRAMRSERHYFTTLNYIHHNPVKHGYVSLWTDWPSSSVHWYMEQKGRLWLKEVFQEYPVLNYGEKWDHL